MSRQKVLIGRQPDELFVSLATSNSVHHDMLSCVYVSFIIISVGNKFTTTTIITTTTNTSTTTTTTSTPKSTLSSEPFSGKVD